MICDDRIYVSIIIAISEKKVAEIPVFSVSHKVAFVTLLVTESVCKFASHHVFIQY